MPVIRRGDHHDVEVFTINQVTEVSIARSLPFSNLDCTVNIRLPDIADRGHFNILAFEEVFQVPPPHASHANESTADSVVGAHNGIPRRVCGRYAADQTKTRGFSKSSA